MSNVKVMTDSVASVPPELSAKYNIKVIIQVQICQGIS